MTTPETPDTRFLELQGQLPWVDALWAHRGGNAGSATIPADGCVDLIVRVASIGTIEALVHPASVCAHQAFVDADECVFGVRLRVGHGGPLLGRSAVALQVVKERSRHGVQLLELEALVGEILDDVGRPPALIEDFLEFARETCGAARLGEWHSAPGGERGLQRATRQWLGMTPKAFMRIERAWAARRAIMSGQRLAEVAADLGYSDQAHLTREFRELLGVKPREVRPVGILQDRAARS